MGGGGRGGGGRAATGTPTEAAAGGGGGKGGGGRGGGAPIVIAGGEGPGGRFGMLGVVMALAEVANMVLGSLCIPPTSLFRFAALVAEVPPAALAFVPVMYLRMGLLAASILSALEPCRSGLEPGACPVSSSV